MMAKEITLQITPQELDEIIKAYQIIQTFLNKIISPNELYRHEFLKGLQTAQLEVEKGQFEEATTFDEFIS